jgi:hypothetical protein
MKKLSTIAMLSLGAAFGIGLATAGPAIAQAGFARFAEVKVVNTPAQAIPVQETGVDKGIPFAVTDSVVMSVGSAGTFKVIFTVPAGKYAVIKQISYTAPKAGAGDTGVTYMALSGTYEGETSVTYVGPDQRLPFFDVGTDQAHQLCGVGNITASFGRSTNLPSGGSTSCSVFISGELFDYPPQ